MYLNHTKRKSPSGYETKVRVYECENCEDCQYKPRCTKAQGNKKISFSQTFATKRQQSLENITSPLGIVLRMNRSIQVEGVFGVLKEITDFEDF
ncbi:transposase [Clostridium estertheticum]|uniref:transposase n=1 Tax=Clostridium estertheticum TaxID=238834 RepID=UPI0013E92AA4